MSALLDQIQAADKAAEERRAVLQMAEHLLTMAANLRAGGTLTAEEGTIAVGRFDPVAAANGFSVGALHEFSSSLAVGPAFDRWRGRHDTLLLTEFRCPPSDKTRAAWAAYRAALAEDLEARGTALARAQGVETPRLGLLETIRAAEGPTYLAGAFQADVCARLERFSDAVARKVSPRLILTVPPRHGITTILRHFARWHAQRHGESVTRAVHSGALADEDGAPGVVGVGAPLTGQGCAMLIVDAPIKDAAEATSPARREFVWQWYASTARTRLAPGGGILLAGPRWHADDLAGRVLDGCDHVGENPYDPANDGPGMFVYPALSEEGVALDPTRWPAETLIATRGAVKEHWWRTLYQGCPEAL